MVGDETRRQGAQRRAEEQFARQATFQKERAKADAADIAKTARLRALRLAKEAADKAAAEAALQGRGPELKPEATPAPKRRVQKITISS